MEQWLINQVADVIVLLVLGIIGYIKMDRFQVDAIKQLRALDEDIKVHLADTRPHPNRQDFKEHIASMTPHVLCVSHGTVFQEIKNELSRIHSDMQTQDLRLSLQISTSDNKIFRLLEALGKGGSDHDRGRDSTCDS